MLRYPALGSTIDVPLYVAPGAAPAEDSPGARDAHEQAMQAWPALAAVKIRVRLVDRATLKRLSFGLQRAHAAEMARVHRYRQEHPEDLVAAEEHFRTLEGSEEIDRAACEVLETLLVQVQGIVLEAAGQEEDLARTADPKRLIEALRHTGHLELATMRALAAQVPRAELVFC